MIYTESKTILDHFTHHWKGESATGNEWVPTPLTSEAFTSEVVSSNIRDWPCPPASYWKKLPLSWPKLGHNDAIPQGLGQGFEFVLLVPHAVRVRTETFQVCFIIAGTLCARLKNPNSVPQIWVCHPTDHFWQAWFCPFPHFNLVKALSMSPTNSSAKTFFPLWEKCILSGVSRPGVVCNL